MFLDAPAFEHPKKDEQNKQTARNKRTNKVAPQAKEISKPYNKQTITI